MGGTLPPACGFGRDGTTVKLHRMADALAQNGGKHQTQVILRVICLHVQVTKFGATPNLTRVTRVLPTEVQPHHCFSCWPDVRACAYIR
jgi:hypothetical protein